MSIFRQKTVSDITARFQKIADELAEHETASLQMVKHHEERAADHNGQRAVHADEAKRASRVREKIAALVE